MIFPNIEDALDEVLGDLGSVVTHLPKEINRRVPIIYLSPIPSAGATESFMSEDRYLIEVFNAGRTATRDLCLKVAERLDGNYFATKAGLLDRVEVVLRPNETPLEDDTLNSFNLSILVQTRATN